MTLPHGHLVSCTAQGWGWIKGVVASLWLRACQHRNPPGPGRGAPVYIRVTDALPVVTGTPQPPRGGSGEQQLAIHTPDLYLCDRGTLLSAGTSPSHLTSHISRLSRQPPWRCRWRWRETHAVSVRDCLLGVPAVVQPVKDLVLSPRQHRLSPWPGAVGKRSIIVTAVAQIQSLA